VRDGAGAGRNAGAKRSNDLRASTDAMRALEGRSELVAFAGGVALLLRGARGGCHADRRDAARSAARRAGWRGARGEAARSCGRRRWGTGFAWTRRQSGEVQTGAAKTRDEFMGSETVLVIDVENDATGTARADEIQSWCAFWAESAAFSAGASDFGSSMPMSVDRMNDNTVALLFYTESLPSRIGGRLLIACSVEKTLADSGTAPGRDFTRIQLERACTSAMKNTFGAPMRTLPRERNMLRRFSNDAQLMFGARMSIRYRPPWVRLGRNVLRANEFLRQHGAREASQKGLQRELAATRRQTENEALEVCVLNSCSAQAVRAQLLKALLAVQFAALGPFGAAGMSVEPAPEPGPISVRISERDRRQLHFSVQKSKTTGGVRVVMHGPRALRNRRSAEVLVRAIRAKLQSDESA